jgi:hypothetical protein
MSSNIFRLSTIAVIVAACSKDTTGVTTPPPPPPAVSQLQVVSGTGQVAKPGAVLAESLIVRAVTSTGLPVKGDTITWIATAGGGTLSPARAVTDSAGRAAAQWTVGQASADSAMAKTGSVTASFSARAVTSSSPITWTVEASGTTHNLNAVWGTSGSNVYAVGDSGAFLHYDGMSWSQVQSQDSLFQAIITPHSYPSYTIWGSSATDVYVGADGGALVHFDGQHWQLVSGVPGGLTVLGIWGDSPTDVWIATAPYGMNVYQYNGSQWLVQNMPPGQPGSHPVWCPSGWMIAALSATDVFMYDRCDVLNTFDGTAWHVNAATSFPGTMSALWAVPGNAIYAIGGGVGGSSFSRGVYVASSPTSWTLVPGSPTLSQTNLTPGGTLSDMNGLWGDAANDLFAVVADTVYHYDGTSWTAHGDPSWHGWAMYGPSLSDIFVVGPHGFILHGRR